MVSGMIFGPGVILTRKNLSGLDLSNLNLTNAVFINSDLTNVNFTNSNLTNVNVQQLSVVGAPSFDPALLSGANFTNANIYNMSGIGDVANYTTTKTYISVTGGAPSKMPPRTTIDYGNSRIVLKP